MHNFRFIFLSWASTEIVVDDFQSKNCYFSSNEPLVIAFFTLCLKLFVLATVSLRTGTHQADGQPSLRW